MNGNQTNLNNMESNTGGVGFSTETMTTTDTMPQSGRNRFVSKKTLAQGMFDVALLSSNTNQLVQLFKRRPRQSSDGFRTSAIVLLIMSIMLQIVVGGLLIALVTRGRNPRDPNDSQRRPISRRLNNSATILIFIITVLNVIIPSLQPETENDWRNRGTSQSEEWVRG